MLFLVCDVSWQIALVTYRVAHLLRERIMLTAIRQLRMGGLKEFNMY